MAEVQLRPARIDELEMLNVLSLSSKAVWGYDQAFLEASRAELTLTEDDLERDWICVADIAGDLAGIAQLRMDGQEGRVEKLFVKPGLTRQGVGRALFEATANAARDQGATRLVIESDPGMVAFYRAMGAERDGEVPGAVPGRNLPRLIYAL